jgi:hypothetical protein
MNRAHLPLIAILVLAGCASVRLADSWKAPAFAGPAPRNVLVVAVAANAANRQIAEDSLAAGLRAAGVQAAASYTLTPAGGMVVRDQVKEAVGKAGADGVLVTRVLRAEKRTQVVSGSGGTMPPYAGGFYGSGLYGWYGANTGMPPAVFESDVLVLETTLWEVKSEKVIWGATSEVFDPGAVPKASADLSKALVAKMRSDGVL